MKFARSVCCLAVITVMLGGELTAVIAALVTSDSSSDSTHSCETAVEHCMAIKGKNDGCSSMSLMMECLPNTLANNCSVDSTRVSFSNLRPLVDDICKEIVNYSASCRHFLKCAWNQAHYAFTFVGGINTTQAARLTNTGYWCNYTHQMINCFLGNNVTCRFAHYTVKAIESQKRWLSDTCSGENDTVTSYCKQAVKKCMKSMAGEILNCSTQIEEMLCLAQSKSHLCPVSETNVSFRNLSVIFGDVCRVLAISREVSRNSMDPFVTTCLSLSDCLEHTDFALTPGIGSQSGPPSSLYDELLHSSFWCRHLVQVTNCYLKYGTKCTGSKHRVNMFDDTTAKQLRVICHVDIGNPGAWNHATSFPAAPVFHIALLLLVALMFNVPAQVEAHHDHI